MTGAVVTITGRLTADPVLRTTNGGAGFLVTNFTVAHTPRKQNETTKEWEDAGEPLFLRVTAWRQLAENIASTLRKGDLATVTGRLGVRTYTPEVGVPRTEVTCDADAVSVDLGRAVATVQRNVAAEAPAALRAV